MTKCIIVGDVFDYNDCGGKKFIDITDMEYLDLIPSRFRMTSNLMLPFQKLMLSSVEREDYVDVVVSNFTDDPLVIGEYVSNHSPIDNRPNYCRCNTPLITDGFDVYCPNAQCGLTLLARLNRLANTTFFPFEEVSKDVENGEYFAYTGSEYSYTPFKPIMDPKLWGYEFDNLDTILLNIKFDVSLATFLVESLFIGFLDHLKSPMSYNTGVFHTLSYFFGYMTELINRRDYQLNHQNVLIKNFIWVLGIKYLNPDIINKMLTYEVGMNGFSTDPLSPYLHLLTRPDVMSSELRIPLIQANLIYNEVYKRRFEIYDIFSNYSSFDITSELMKHMFR